MKNGTTLTQSTSALLLKRLGKTEKDELSVFRPQTHLPTLQDNKK